MRKGLTSFAILAVAALPAQQLCGQSRTTERAARNAAHASERVSAASREPGLPSESADRLMADMLASVRGRDSISARIRQKIDVLGEKLVGTGSYLQQGRGESQKLRLELKIQVANQTTNLQQVCDGNFLWVQQDNLEKPSLTRIDIRRVREAMFDQAGRRSRFDQIQLALCGLPKLIESLHKNFEFKLVQSDRLDGVPVWVVRGAWRPEALLEAYPDPKATPAAGQGSVGEDPSGKAPPPSARRSPPSNSAAGKLPPHAPEVVVLLIGRDDLFPYRIEFRRRVEVDDKSPVRTDETRPLVIMEWFEVALDTPLDERQFIYRPGDLEFSDGTRKLLERMGLAAE